MADMQSIAEQDRLLEGVGISTRVCKTNTHECKIYNPILVGFSENFLHKQTGNLSPHRPELAKC